MITLEEAERKQQELQGLATDVLEEYGILKMLADYGKVEPVGSYAYGLMVYPDIDFTVINPDITPEKALDLGKVLFRTEGIRNFRVYDFTSSLREEYTKNGEGPPNGFCFEAKVFHRKSREKLGIWQWKLDIWLVPAKPEGMNRTKGLESSDWFEKRTQEEKDAILLLKAQLWEQGVYIHKGVGSFHVYRAVIEGIRGVDDFLTWMEKTYDYKLS